MILKRNSMIFIVFLAGIVFLSACTQPLVVDSVLTPIEDEQVPPGTTINEVIELLPTTVEVKLDNEETKTADVSWTSADYNPNEAGVYEFVGALTIDGEEIDLTVSAQITVVAGATASKSETVEFKVTLFDYKQEAISGVEVYLESDEQTDTITPVDDNRTSNSNGVTFFELETENTGQRRLTATAVGVYGEIHFYLTILEN